MVMWLLLSLSVGWLICLAVRPRFTFCDTEYGIRICPYPCCCQGRAGNTSLANAGSALKGGKKGLHNGVDTFM